MPIHPYTLRFAILRRFSVLCLFSAPMLAGAVRAQAQARADADFDLAMISSSTVEPVAAAIPEPLFATPLPDAPGMYAVEVDQNSVQQPPHQPASRYDKFILPGQPAPRLTAHDKFVLGIKDAFSPYEIGVWFLVAGYEQVLNNSPNYPQTGKGYLQRAGAAAARDSSEGVFCDSILAPLLREDPRYYQMGPGHNFFKRLIYAGTRPLWTRTDGGGHTINLADLGGDAAGSALTNAYYPQLNRGFTETAKTFGGSVGGDALGFVVDEFLSDVLQAVHLQKPK